MILVPANKVEKIKYFSTLLGLIFIEITRGPLKLHGNAGDFSCILIAGIITLAMVTQHNSANR